MKKIVFLTLALAMTLNHGALGVDNSMTGSPRESYRLKHPLRRRTV